MLWMCRPLICMILDEHENSNNGQNFLKLLHLYRKPNDKVSTIILHNAPGNKTKWLPLQSKKTLCVELPKKLSKL